MLYIYISESTRDACQGPFIAREEKEPARSPPSVGRVFPLLVAEPGHGPSHVTQDGVVFVAGWRVGFREGVLRRE